MTDYESPFVEELNYLDHERPSDSTFVENEAESESKRHTRIEFYDKSDIHFAFIGRMFIPSKKPRWEIRLIDIADLRKMFKSNRKLRKQMHHDLAINFPTLYIDKKLFPHVSSNKYIYDRRKIARKARRKSKFLYVWRMKEQRAAVKKLISDATKKGREQGAYIVLNTVTWKLEMVRATPIRSSADEFVFDLPALVWPGGEKEAHLPKSFKNHTKRRVIGTVHTHYIKRQKMIEQSPQQGTTFTPGGEPIDTPDPRVSRKDIASAKHKQIVVYAVEQKQIHKALPDGTVVNEMKRDFNLFVDALETFGGMPKSRRKSGH